MGARLWVSRLRSDVPPLFNPLRWVLFGALSNSSPRPPGVLPHLAAFNHRQWYLVHRGAMSPPGVRWRRRRVGLIHFALGVSCLAGLFVIQPQGLSDVESLL